LIHAPTGVDKAFAAWFGPLLEYMASDRREANAPMEKAAPPLTVLWVTPLRALAADIQSTLNETVEYFKLPWSAACRTGDTSLAVKNRQKKYLPTALITTPESLNLLLSNPGARQKFNRLKMVVADEWHELVGSKRGVLLEFALARLKSWNAQLRIWGLSATLGNIETAMRVLLGDNAGQGTLVRGLQPKSIIVESFIPRNRALSLGRAPRPKPSVPDNRQNRIGQKHAGFYQHALPDRTPVPGHCRRLPGMERLYCIASWLTGSQIA
jgi:ATP-dependent Lhr-like helicase